LSVAGGSAPSLPSEVSPDGREIWDWAGKMSEHIQRLARIKELREAIRKCGKECGDCDKWMKSSECPRERPGTGKRSGYSVGPSCGAPVCAEYVEKPWTTQRRAELTRELESLLPNKKGETTNNNNDQSGGLLPVEKLEPKLVVSSDGLGSVGRSCNDCQHCLMRGELITCGMLLAEIAGDAEEGEEIDTELADGIHHTFAEECSDFLPNAPDQTRSGLAAK
jgi:hypothetical protein